jgi:hypothetical protein
MAHTPGPWIVGATSMDSTAVNADGPLLVARVLRRPDRAPYPMSEEEHQANARLIAAAPALLDCLKTTAMLTRSLLEMELPRDYLVPIRAIHRDTVDAIIKAAGAKAISPVDSSQCRQPECYCHDEDAWIPGETYLDGCPDCGCRWRD